MGRAGTRPRYTLHFTATKFREQRFVCRQAEKMELFLLCWPCTSVTNHLVNCAPCSNPSTTLPGRKKNQQAPTHNPPLGRPNRRLSLSETITNNLFHKYKITLTGVGGMCVQICTMSCLLKRNSRAPPGVALKVKQCKSKNRIGQNP